MRLVNTKTQASHAVRVHAKKPSYFDAAERSRKGTVDGREVTFVLHPKKSGDRVNFAGAKADTWLYVDDQSLWDAVAGKGKLEFVTAEGRAAKAAPATTEAAEAATAA